MANFTKDPDADLDYTRDWAPWLAGGDTIETSTWIVEDGIDHSRESHTDTAATIWLTGGTVGRTYSVTNRITTTSGRTDDRTFTIEIRQR
ncbi:hypothetical protein GUY44_07230 [Pimelobacter simplex]|uniref:Uncharacterized protein n=1 Tax=Nocardioides simplex TaxID=2045 RepID=A0A0A1DQX2_NOCSI|nr:hypothetical protein [Pimelobacter simplex]AIY17795.1 hypothetical protein KR76_15330 [Pimelobacter simplex]MCG8150265.1 hypothetical protein [Pimelobacter simplex]GEB13526.1 hypothetical protein NSI01_18410 [Pimelobacter simplex]SFM72270.1 hypothetical protein SAMN05421671_3146 [Pimelobacter simplex]